LDGVIVILGVLLGLIFAVKGIASFAERKPSQRSPSQLRGNVQLTPPQLPSTPQPPPPAFAFHRLDESMADIFRDAAREAVVRRVPSPPSCRQAGNEPLNVKDILENWRKSLLGLIRLAESNLQLAKSQAGVMNYKGAVEAAATSVENVSRALLHCYGEKPDLNSGQEEPLRLLARRLQGEERAQFEKAIDEAVQLHRNKIVEAYLSEKSIEAPLLNEVRTQRILETAGKIFAQFKRIWTNTSEQR